MTQNPAGALKPDKEKSSTAASFRIDGLVALLMAIAMACRPGVRDGQNYQSKGRITLRDMYDTIAKTSDDLIADGHNYQMVAGVLIKAAIRLIENHAPSQKDELAGYEWLDSLLPKNDTTI